MDPRTRSKLRRLLKKFPETWSHTREKLIVDGAEKTFHHVDYPSKRSGKQQRVRLVSHVSEDMCELLVLLKIIAPEMSGVSSAAPVSAIVVKRGPGRPRKFPSIGSKPKREST